ncbi:MAG: BON domain-containing protein [Anaerolineales bacterium]|nr:BON domain-containing protein [Anaerolineales bacterium]
MKTNSQLQRDVQEELNWEPSVTATGIGVSAKDGVITLTGSVPSYYEKAVAERVVGRVAGVQGIAEELSVRLPTLSERTDTDIAASALNALAWNIAVPTDRAKVRVEDGWITLSGEVEWHFQQLAAENAVVHLMGVKGVTNAITLKPGAATVAAEIKAKIEQAFNRMAVSEASEITVSVQDGKVTLRGRARSWRERDEAVASVWAAPGVTAVDNKIVAD